MKPTLIFFGSGPVAAKSIQLLANTFEIEAIITKPTTEREMRSVCPDIPIFTVQTKLELDRLIELKNFSSTYAILIDFGIIVSQKVIDYFEKGIINSHFSLLPELRGADPISFAVLEGKTKTGVSLMLLSKGMDEGTIISVGVVDLDGSETTLSLTDSLIKLSYQLLVDSVPKYLNGLLLPVDQDFNAEKFDLSTSYTRKLTKSDGVIDWNKSAQQIEREIRAYSGWPKSHTQLGKIDCVVTSVKVEFSQGNPGEIFVNDKKLGVYCGKDAVVINSLKPVGKKEMSSHEFLAGYKSKLDLA